MSRSAAILHVEDDPNDVLLFNIAWRRKNAVLPVHSVSDGQEALKYLEGCGSYSDRGRFPLPALVILDLKLPGISGFDVLERLRSEPSCRTLPVFVLSSSFHPQDMARAKELGADGYFVKRYDFADIVEAISSRFGVPSKDRNGSGGSSCQCL